MRFASNRAYPWSLHVATSPQDGGRRFVGLLTQQLRAPSESAPAHKADTTRLFLT